MSENGADLTEYGVKTDEEITWSHKEWGVPARIITLLVSFHVSPDLVTLGVLEKD